MRLRNLKRNGDPYVILQDEYIVLYDTTIEQRDHLQLFRLL